MGKNRMFLSLKALADFRTAGFVLAAAAVWSDH